MTITLALRRFESLRQSGLPIETLFLKRKKKNFRVLVLTLAPVPAHYRHRGLYREHPSGLPLDVEFWVNGHELCQDLAVETGASMSEVPVQAEGRRAGL